MAKVHLMIGIQGSGKSTFSNQLSEKENIMIVSTDRVRQANPGWSEDKIVLIFSLVSLLGCVIALLPILFNF